MKPEILLVEDSSYKRDRVFDVLKDAFPDIEVSETHSFNSGSRALEAGQFKVVILDMSLPTYDRTNPQGGGRFRTLGGREIARKLVRRSLETKIIFLTQYESFSDRSRSISLEKLVEELKKECGPKYFGTVYYDSAKSNWKPELIDAIGRALNESSPR